nr:putative reverse transcriptase domain-containing protein [Tanacetum cinerariifolium]
MDLMNRVCKPYLDKFVIMFIDDILIYSKSKEDHKLEEVCFLGHVVNNNDINVNSSKIEAMKNWKVPKTPSEIRSFLGLTVYCDTSNQGHVYVLMQRGKNELNMRQQRWIKLFSDYNCEIRYHLGKANVVVDAFSRKERVKPRQVRAISMTIRPSVTDNILVAQGDVRTIFMDETHASSGGKGLWVEGEVSVAMGFKTLYQVDPKVQQRLHFVDNLSLGIRGEGGDGLKRDSQVHEASGVLLTPRINTLFIELAPRSPFGYSPVDPRTPSDTKYTAEGGRGVVGRDI